jgi:glutamine amidotransferase
MDGLKKNKLNQAVKSAVGQHKPILGVCLGMQLLMTTGHEFGSHRGLGLIDGVVNKISTTAKLPQIGWNDIKIKKKSSLLEGLKSGKYFYFVHSFVVRPKNPAVMAATTNYGGDNFCSVIEYKNIYGTQFHPEKSGPDGLRIYQNFVNL